MPRKGKQPKPAGHSVAFKTDAQAASWASMSANDLTFLLGSAGSGKTFLAMAYAIKGILDGRFESIVLTRPIVEAGERLGFLPGTAAEKIDPYMLPLYDAMDSFLGKNTAARAAVNKAVVLAPLGFMRGRTFNRSVCVFDEAQNATHVQLKLFLTRLGNGSKAIVTGDPDQSDLPFSPSPLVGVVDRLRGLAGVHRFEACDVVRHPLVAAILERLD